MIALTFAAAVPGYWMHETSGVLRPAVEAYLRGDDMTPAQIAAVRAYLRQWINGPGWTGGRRLADLRARIDSLTSRAAIASWLADADAIGIVPL